ncbi:MAG: thermonuclease family protein [Pseudomonadota bacterium]
MFGWRKRKDGFEWHKYVRTTILVRREHRRQRLDDAREAAADGLKAARLKAARGMAEAGHVAAEGLKAAGSKGAHLGRAGLASASRGASGALSALASLPGRVAARLGPHLGPIAARLEPLAEWLRRPAVTVPLAVVATVAAVAGIGRAISFGLDSDTVTALAVAACALTLLVLPRMAGGEQAAGGGDDATRVGVTRRVLGQLAPNGQGVVGAAALAGVGLLAWAALGPPVATTPDSTVTAHGDSGSGQGRRGALAGRALAVAGDRLRVAGTMLRLDGVEAPDRNQSCKRASGKRWPCGREAAQALGRLVRNRRVECDRVGVDADGLVLARCRIEGSDMGAELVRKGHVFAVSSYFARYASEESEARAAKAGVWQGEALRPAAYRAKLWEEAKQKAPAGCPIKGQVSRQGRIYVLPWSDRYAGIAVSEKRGERWFCSEAEAQSAGWKPVGSS